MAKDNILEVKDLSVSFTGANGKTHVLNKVNLSVPRGESVGLVGESGCGKTTTMRSILNLLASNGTIENGEIFYNGKDILKMSKKELLEYRQTGVSMIFQDPSAALNPVFTIEQQFVGELKYALRDRKYKKSELVEIAKKSLESVSLADPERILASYPFQLSGGMRQRVCIAMALSANSSVLLADEPGTALDVTIQDQILKLIKKLIEEQNLSVIFVSHSLGVIKQVTTSVNVMYAGNILEKGPTGTVFENPLHPYTKALMKCLPKLTGEGIAEGIPGRIPDYANPPKGCRFAPRCPYCMEKCLEEMPPMAEIEEGHEVACFCVQEGK